jgi:hypothetical protein
MTSSGGDLGEQVEQAWIELERSWADDAAHRRFIALCSASGQLAEAGRRYRLVQSAGEQRSEEAGRRLSAVLAAALVGLENTRVVRASPPSRLFWLGCGAALALVSYLLALVLRLLSR